MPETRLPSIPRIPSGQFQRACDAMKEILEVRLGRRGDPLDEGLTRRDLLEDSDIIAAVTTIVNLSTGLGTPETCTISGGVATASGNSSYLIIDTEGAAASDDLDRIDGFAENDTVLIRSANSGRVITVKRGDYFKMTSDFTLNSIFDRIMFDCIGGDIMVQHWRSNNA